MRRTSGNLSLYSAHANGTVMTSLIEQARAARAEQPVLPSAPAIDPMFLAPLQQAALLMMSESHVKRAVIARILEDAQDAPSMPDFRALARCGLARYAAGKRLHELTDAGREAVRVLQQKLCKQFDIHLLLGPKGSSGETVSFSCPCGWSQSFRNSHTAPGNARTSWNRHVATVEGMSKLVVALKPPGMRAEG